MQAVVLAAGRGTRMGRLTETLPKPMLEVAGKTLLEHKFDVLPDDVDEIIIVIGYLGETIKAKFGDSYHGKKMTYVEQANIVGGTADALWQAKDHLKGKFLVLMGDDIYTEEDIRAVVKRDWALLVQRLPNTSGGGKVLVNPDGTVADIIESSHHDGSAGAISTNMFALDTRLFEHPQVPKAPDSSEMGLPQTVLAAAKAARIPFYAVETTRWLQVTTPEDLAWVGQILRVHK